MSEQFLAIITARGGSKGVPNKNIRPLLGKPLISYTIEAALGSTCCSGCFVSTDDSKIAAIATEHGSAVIMRPSAISQDDSRSEDAVVHALETIAKERQLPEWCALLQPTSPLRSSKDIDECFNLAISKQANSIISVCESETSPYKMLLIKDDLLTPLFNQELLSAPRQNLNPVYKQNGAIYLFRIKPFLRSKTFLIDPALPHKMSSDLSIDIDRIEDFEKCEKILAKQSKSPTAP